MKDGKPKRKTEKLRAAKSTDLPSLPSSPRTSETKGRLEMNGLKSEINIITTPLTEEKLRQVLLMRIAEIDRAIDRCLSGADRKGVEIAYASKDELKSLAEYLEITL